jgi:hypothetical protein
MWIGHQRRAVTLTPRMQRYVSLDQLKEAAYAG